MTEQEMADFVGKLRNLHFPNVKMPTVKFNARLRTTAGRAWAQKIEINKNLMEMVGSEGMKQTLAHEFAHCAQFQLYDNMGIKTQPHGWEWQKIMEALGYEPRTTHKLFEEYKIAKPKGQRRWEYECECGQEHPIATVTHNRIQKGTHKYACSDCNSVLKWTGKEGE